MLGPQPSGLKALLLGGIQDYTCCTYDDVEMETFSAASVLCLLSELQDTPTFSYFNMYNFKHIIKSPHGSMKGSKTSYHHEDNNNNRM